MNVKKRKQFLEEYSETDPIFAQCVLKVGEFFKKEPKKAIVWFFVRNPLLGEVAPIEMALMGRSQKLLQFIVSAQEGNVP